MKDYCVELKVCEGCGALFLRAAGLNNGTGQSVARSVAGMGLRSPAGRATGRAATGGNVTCHACALRLSEFPAPRERKRRGFECRRVRTAVCVGGAR